MLLIHPPQARNCEPPVAPAHLAGALKAAGEEVAILDGALEAYLWLSEQERGDDSDLQAARVSRNREKLLSMKEWESSLESWKRRIADLKLMASSSRSALEAGIRITPADFDNPHLTPLKSADLLYCWNHPEENLFFPWFSGRLTELLNDPNCRTIGFSISYLSQALTAMAMAGWLKREYPHVRFIMGGGLINSWLKGPSEKLFPPLIREHMIEGNGEEAIVRFVGREYRGPGIPLYTDPGQYLSPGRIIPYSASRGCSWKRCTFCSELWEDNPYCETPARQAVRQLKTLSETYAPDLIHLCDSEISPLLIKELIQNPPGPMWYGFSRFLPEMRDPAYCEDLARSGCRMLCLGLESGDSDVLKSLKKGIRLDYVTEMLRNLKEAGILTFVYIMFGTPSENREAAQRTEKFIIDNSKNISFLNVSIFNMPVNSDEATGLQAGTFYDGDLSLYSEFNHPAGWNRGEIRTFLSRQFRRNKEIKKILKRTPPVFTSNIAPFLKDSEFL